MEVGLSAWRLLLLPMGELMQDWTESPVAGWGERWGGFKRELRVDGPRLEMMTVERGASLRMVSSVLAWMCG